MKKVIASLLMILVMASAFAESKTINVSLTVNEKPPRVAFTEKPYSVVAENGPTNMVEPIDFGDLTETAEAKEFYASADTNSADHLTLKIYGTALTLKNDSIYDGSQTVGLTLSVLGDTNNASSPIPDEVVFSKPNTGNGRSTDNTDCLTLIEGDDSGSGSGAAGVGFRALTWKLELAVDTVQAGKVQAGPYEACIWLEVGSGPTGA